MKREDFDETSLQRQIEGSLDRYWKKYRPFMEALENESPLAKIKGGVDEMDLWSLGSLLEQFDNYNNFMGESGSGSVGELGMIPQVALDVITAAYGTSVAPLIASVQPLSSERDIIYYRKVVTRTPRPGVPVGTVLSGPTVPYAGVVYAGDQVTEELFTTVPASGTNPATTVYSGVVAGGLPMRPSSFRIEVPGLGLRAVDDGAGNLLGVGIQGSIDYNSGAYTVRFLDDPTSAVPVTATYGTSFEEGEIPRVTTELASEQIFAREFVLGSFMGMFKAYALRKRFGKVAEDETTQILADEMGAETATAIINDIYAQTPTTDELTWSETIPMGISEEQHYRSLKIRIARAEGVIADRISRGTINVICAGNSMAAALSAIPSFRKQQYSGVGPVLFGDLDGIKVIRCPSLPSREMICFYKGSAAFDVTAVWGVYMPFVLKQVASIHPLRTDHVAAMWGGIKTVVPQYSVKVKMIP